MKKVLLGLVLMLGLMVGSAHAQTLPPDTQINFSALNISMENQDAEQVGARAGDVLRYELKLSSDQAITDYETSINVGEILSAAELLDTGLAALDGEALAYPLLSRSSAWEQAFTFFARVAPDCGGMQDMSTAFGAQTVKVSLQCQMPRTGPTGLFVGIFATLLLFGYLIFGHRRTT